MEKTVSYREYRAELQELEYKIMQIAPYVKICGREEGMTTVIAEKPEINWSARGSVSVEETINFMKALDEAISACNSFKYTGYEIEF